MQLKLMVKNRLRKLSIEKEADYDNPSWAHKQAHANGARRTLQDILNLLYFVEDK